MEYLRLICNVTCAGVAGRLVARRSPSCEAEPEDAGLFCRGRFPALR